MPAPVLNAVKDHLDLEARMGGYEAAAQAMPLWEHAYDAIATMLNCDRMEVAITDNASRAWELAFHAISFKAGDRILTAHAEYVSNWLAFLLVQQRTGCSVELVPDDGHGQIDLEALRNMMDDRVRLVALTHAGHWLRHPERHRKEIPAWTTWYGLPLCASRSTRAVGTGLHRTHVGHLGKP